MNNITSHIDFEPAERAVDNLTDRILHTRAMMVWRQMGNIYGIDAWQKDHGARTRSDGRLSYVAMTWAVALKDLEDSQIRRGLDSLRKDNSEIPTLWNFRAICHSFTEAVKK